MKFTPHQYQLEAMRWIFSHPRCALFIDLGLGKTVITLTAAQQLIDDCEVTKVLVIAPKKVAEATWTAEAEKWEHLKGLRVVKVLGTEKQRNVALAQKADVYVTGRDNFVWLMGRYDGKLPFDMLVIDELTSFKSNTSQRFKAMRLATPTIHRVVGLTGTPAPNGMIDLWAQMYCIDMGERLGRSITKYRDVYFEIYKWNNIIVRCELKKGADEVIRHKIADICLSMQAKDYLQLPDMMTHTVCVPLTAAVMDRYQKFEEEKVLEFVATVPGGSPVGTATVPEAATVPGGSPSGNDAVLATSAAALMNKLSQFANGAVYDEDRNVHEIHDEKLDALAEIIEAANGQGVLVFYQYKHDIARIQRRLKGLRVAVYESEQQLHDWNARKIDVLLAHPASTAYGLNMQDGGHYIAWFGTGWNLELYQQANARLHRQGQRYPVHVYQLICPGTVDEKAAAALDAKKSVQQALLDSLNTLITKYTNV